MALAKQETQRAEKHRKRNASKSQYGIGEAKAHFSEIIARVELTGEEVLLTRHGLPVARLVPERGQGPRQLGFAKGRVQFLPGWNKPLTYRDLFGE
jgi:prevent-host-death family protein